MVLSIYEENKLNNKLVLCLIMKKQQKIGVVYKIIIYMRKWKY